MNMIMFFFCSSYIDMDIHLVSYYIGIFIVFFTHLYMLFDTTSSKTMMFYHALINLFGAVCIAYYFMHKEEFIYF
jgi:hypothetical protein